MSDNLKVTNDRINISGEKARNLDTLAKLKGKSNSREKTNSRLQSKFRNTSS